MSRLRWSELLAAVSAAALAAFMFGLSWFGGAPRRDGWQALPALRWPLLVMVAVTLAAALAQGRRGPGLAVALDAGAIVVSLVTTILLAVRLATTGAPLRSGAFLGLAACIGVTIGIFEAMRAEQGSTPGPGAPIELLPVRDRP